MLLYTIGALTCVILVHLLGTAPWVMALAVATTIKLTQLTRTVHPLLRSSRFSRSFE